MLRRKAERCGRAGNTTAAGWQQARRRLHPNPTPLTLKSIGRAFGQDVADRLEAIRLQDQLLERLETQVAIEKERDPLRKMQLRIADSAPAAGS